MTLTVLAGLGLAACSDSSAPPTTADAAPDAVSDAKRDVRAGGKRDATDTHEAAPQDNDADVDRLTRDAAAADVDAQDASGIRDAPVDQRTRDVVGDGNDLDGHLYRRTLYVNASAPDGGDGASWATAFRSLDDALAVVGKDEEVWVAAGTYRPTRALPPQPPPNDGGADAGGEDAAADGESDGGGSDGSAADGNLDAPEDADDAGIDPKRMVRFWIRDVSVFGGFAGTEDRREDRDWLAHETILSGDIGMEGERGDNAYRVVELAGSGGTPAERGILDGFTITGGMSGSARETSGAGMRIVAPASVIHCRITDNEATSEGGGFTGAGIGLEIIDSVVTNNRAHRGGGGSLVGQSSITGSRFTSNTADEGGAVSFGALSGTSISSEHVVLDSSFEDNSSAGIRIDSVTTRIKRSTFRRNQGSAVSMPGSSTLNRVTLSVSESTFEDNRAVNGAGVFSEEAATVDHSTFINNIAENEGGGVYMTMNGNTSALPSGAVSGCKFNGNQAGRHGGGLYAKIGGFSVSSSEFTENTAEAGGGAYLQPFYRNMSATNSVFVRNSGGALAFQLGYTGSVSHCTFVTNGISTTQPGNTYSLSINDCLFVGASNSINNVSNLTVSSSTFYATGYPSGVITNSVFAPAIDPPTSGKITQSCTKFEGTDNIGDDPMFRDTTNLQGPDGIWRTADDGLALAPDSPCAGKGATFPE